MQAEPILTEILDRAEGTTCLRFIDPWGETVFNRKQCSVLESEWARLSDLPGDLQEWIGQVRELIAECKVVPHLYLRFIGM